MLTLRGVGVHGVVDVKDVMTGFKVSRHLETYGFITCFIVCVSRVCVCVCVCYNARVTDTTTTTATTIPTTSTNSTDTRRQL